MKISPSWLREFVGLQVNYLQLAEDLTLAGIAVESVSGEGEDTIFEMEITTNRPDAMNHYGVARECSALYDLALRPIEPVLRVGGKAPAEGNAVLAALLHPKPCSSANQADSVPVASAQAEADSSRTSFSRATPSRNMRFGGEGAEHGTVEVRDKETGFAIKIANKDDCARYTARIIRGVTIQASPDPIAKRLLSVDQRPINNAADASNYTLWEMGHPTHAFDLDLLEGKKILVRRAFTGETLKTLDGVERKLSPEDLVIADGKKPVALAGVMGGFDTMITEKTRNILIESAWFDPVAIRKSSRRHGLHTDASHRFERGADFGATSLACARVAQRILESAGGELRGEEIDVVGRQLDQALVQLRLSEVRRILGEWLGVEEVLRILRRLGFEMLPEPGEEPEFTVHIPSWRLDVEREVDLIEEIARLHGYDKFANTLPAYAGAVTDLPDARKDGKVRASLLALGYNEAISLTFISHEEAEQFGHTPVLELENPLSEEASVMRTSLLPGMLNMLAFNLNRGSDNVRLFERGNVFERAGAGAVQNPRICLGVTTPPSVKSAEGWGAHAGLFFEMKGDVENLLRPFECKILSYDAQAAEYYQPGRAARAIMDGAMVGQFGQLHPEITAGRKLRQDVWVAEIYLDELYKHQLREARYEAFPRYPAVERDFSFVFEEAVSYDKIQQAVGSLKIPELRSFVPAEIFRGGSVPAGKYSILLRANFQSRARTLREEEVAQWSGQIIRVLEELGGTLRR
jgi:phenylalanyl-tRNA synthetase beta chain